MKYNEKVLNGKRINLRPFSPLDAKDLYEYAADEVTMKYIDWGPLRSLEEAYDYINNSKGILELAIEINRIKKVIGSIIVYSFTIEKDSENTCEIAYIINKKYRRKGYATESVKLLLSYLSNMNICRVYAKHIEENFVSGMVLKRAGFQICNDKIEYFTLKNGLRKKCICYEYLI